MDKEEFQRQITVRLFQTSNAMQAYIDRLLSHQNITAKQLFMMIIIGTFEENPKLSDIASRFQTSHQNVKQIVNKLVKSGYLDIYKDETDSRITRVKFTKIAYDFWVNRDEQDNQSMGKMYQGLGIDEMSIVLESLLKILNKLNEMEG